jgi:CRISPR-associated endonuclease/helicase Cas3
MIHLLAKSAPAPVKPRTLVEHTLDVVDAASALFGTGEMQTRLGYAWLRFFRLNNDEDQAAFHSNLLASCLFHDWGKANDGMQKLLIGGSGFQLFRHEHLSVLLLAVESVDKWVRQRADIDWDVVLSAVGSHHLKFGDREFAEEVPEETVRMLMDHEDFQNDLLPLISERLGLTGSPSFPIQKYWGFASDPSTFDPSQLRNG